MTDQVFAAWIALGDILMEIAKTDENIANAIRERALAIIGAKPVTAESNQGPPIVAENSDQPTASRPHKAPEPPATVGESRLAIGMAFEREEAPKYSDHLMPVTNEDLSSIETHCRLKGRALRWSARRRRLMAEGADYELHIAPEDRELIGQAKAEVGCYLWMCSRDWQPPEDAKLVEDAAGSFETMADGVGLAHAIVTDSAGSEHLFEQAMDLLAEAQSAARRAVMRINERGDQTQEKVFGWLKGVTISKQIYIQRHMRLDDAADPSNWDNLAARIEEVEATHQRNRQASKDRRRLTNQIRYELTRAKESEDQSLPHWKTVARAVDELLKTGVPPSNRELRDMLLPVIDDIPSFEEPHPGFDAVLADIDRFLETSPPLTQDRSPPTPSAEVMAVAKLLNGKEVVLIGGKRRPAAQAALERAFHCKVHWISTREHESNDRFTPSIVRPATALVLLAIRWSSHSYGDLKTEAESAGKPFVRLPAGYSPNQVAHQILEQCHELLSARRVG